MSDQQHNPLRRFFASRLFLFIALPPALFVVIGYGRSLYQGYKINQEIKALQAEVSTLERKKIESLDILNYVMSDKFVEEKARTELNLIKPGERALIVTNQPQKSDGDTEESGASLQTSGNPLKWWYYIF